ncbi:MAG: hypothetical protein IKV82_05555 [Akkermansia sp.]|nr:hypothetical protein [Akkermansia sp.]
MKYHYCLKNFECGIEHECRYMMLALYKDGELISIEKVREEEADGPFEFCQDIRMGKYCAFDVLADHMGEEKAADLIEGFCFEPCWEQPGIPQIIDGEAYDDMKSVSNHCFQQSHTAPPNGMELRFPALNSFTLWDEEGLRRFSKSFGAGV